MYNISDNNHDIYIHVHLHTCIVVHLNSRYQHPGHLQCAYKLRDINTPVYTPFTRNLISTPKCKFNIDINIPQ